MPRVFEGLIHTYYCQFYVSAYGEDFEYNLDLSFKGQTNGICGAKIPDFLWLLTGLYCGDVSLTVDVLDSPPELEESWEEVVEVSFLRRRDRVGLAKWGDYPFWELPLSSNTDYRVRYCARGMDEGKEVDTPEEDDAEPVDFYSLAFWPAAPAPDTIIKQTSQVAAYCHEHFTKIGT